MKIICTIGLNSFNKQSIWNFARKGMNIARFNCSHLDYSKLESLVNFSNKNFKNIDILFDLQGNKIRVSELLEKEFLVGEKDIVYFSTPSFFNEKKDILKNIVPISFDGDFSELLTSKVILMKDGEMKFEIIEKGENYIKTKTIYGGVIRIERGINFPEISRHKLTLTKKDKDDILLAFKYKADIICLSYVTNVNDILNLKEFIQENTLNYNPKIWAKLETEEGIKNVDSILPEVDGIMLGRGDLSAEIDIVRLPDVQNDLINKMKDSEVDLIIATFLLSNMINKPIPSVSEISDIYRFVSEGVNGFMLSNEVTNGKYPLESLDMLNQIIETTKRG